MSYAWIIDKDHLAEEEFVNSGKAEDNAKGVTGPRDAPDWMCEWLKEGVATDAFQRASVKTFAFKMYDDDRILYYTGRMLTDEGDTERACFGPLGDFGSPNAGCTGIEYLGHPEMDCG